MKFSATLSFHLLALLLLPLLSQPATFTVVNQCSYTVWPAATPSGGHRLDPGETWVFNATPGTTNGRIWARTGCKFDGRGNGSCQTGDCGGVLQCTGSGQAPNTLAEYALNQFQNLDFYDISLVDGFNVPMDFTPTSGGCHDIRCSADIVGQCPGPLQAPGGCNNPCTAFKNSDYCCTGSGSGSGSSCRPTNFSMFFKNRCGEAYSYPKDDPNTFSCPSGTNYRVTFCPCLSENSVGTYTLNGALCTCAAGFKGNAYIAGGCQDINECEDPVTYRCLGTCVNEPGTYRCFCPNGTYGDPRADRCHPIDPNSGGERSALRSVLIGVGIALGLLLLLVVIVLLTRKLKARRVRKLKAKYFMQNKGLLLQKLISSNKDVAERMKIFTIEELARATNNFDRTRILGSGGHGMVYKGILSDLRVVAIKKCTVQRETKKSEMKVQTEIDQFINEVVILSQVSHRNVVNLFGCCLETEVPLLVYEFISNGTLSHHLHAPDRSSSLSWDDRLRIAVETARALSYLHAAASISVFHRDIKPTNILLDDGLTAKVSDFGASRLVLPDQSRITTAIQGTRGYLDPEYFHTGRLTEKSDVYSFGVILVELLTGEKPISPATLPEGRNLATHFIWLMRENRLSEILEARVVEEGEKEVVEAVAALADTCLRLKGEERPTMKEVEMRLEAIIDSKKQLQHPRIAHESNEMECLEGQPETDGNNGDESRQYSMEKEFILSSSFPR